MTEGGLTPPSKLTGEAVRWADALTPVRRTRRDVAIFAVGLPHGDSIEVVAQVTVAESCQVVLFTNLIDRARTAGVMGRIC